METPKARHKIVFISTLSLVAWGGSETLWSEAAAWLAHSGHHVSASVAGWPECPAQISALMTAGVTVRPRTMFVRGLRPELLAKAYSALSRRASLWMLSRELARKHPDLVCISSGSPTDDIDLITFCLRSGRPYVLITQANAEFIWPNDAFAEQMVRVFRGARRAYFVAQPNLRLLEAQLGTCLTNAEVIRNPFNVRWEACPAWPPTAEPLRLACVARLDPSAKGQDLLLHVLASDLWRLRPVEISFYGKGPMETSLRRLVRNLGLNERVRFCGQEKDVERIWASHQALVLPSRFEGLPLAIVEAMLCGRPVIVTDVAGNAELVEDGVTGFVAEAPTVRHLREAMERAWMRRGDWKSIGEAAAKSIREQIPADPAAEFGKRLLALVSNP